MALPAPYWKEKTFKKRNDDIAPAGHCVNTQNLWERVACEKLWKDGFKVYKRGWPDFIAVRGNEIKFIEVKPPQSKKRPARHFDPDQMRLADLLYKHFGIRVDLWNTYEHFDAIEPKNEPVAGFDPYKRVRKFKNKVGYGEHVITSPTQHKSLTETLPTQG